MTREFDERAGIGEEFLDHGRFSKVCLDIMGWRDSFDQ